MKINEKFISDSDGQPIIAYGYIESRLDGNMEC